MIATVKERIERLSMRIPWSGCWIWLGCIDRYGYGKMKGADTLAHRNSYKAHVGEIPKHLQIDHLCRVRSCVNPAHLEAVTPQVNTDRGLLATCVRPNSLKTHCKHGHELAGKNLAIEVRGKYRMRRCKACQILRQRRRRNGIKIDIITRARYRK